ncbi:hypothetical protein ACT7DG_05120 [Bacillus cereus]
MKKESEKAKVERVKEEYSVEFSIQANKKSRKTFFRSEAIKKKTFMGKYYLKTLILQFSTVRKLRLLDQTVVGKQHY